MKQAGAGAEQVPNVDPAHASVFFLDGDEHRRKRTAIARFFTPKAISTRYRAVMERATDELLDAMRASGGGQLDTISFDLAVTVAADIVGLTNTRVVTMPATAQVVMHSIRIALSGQANVDESVVGACPFRIDPDRPGATTANTYLSFGDGSHRCPGAQVALNETRVFLDRLFRVPGIRLARTPTMGWSDALMSYELRGALVSCEPAPRT